MSNRAFSNRQQLNTISGKPFFIIKLMINLAFLSILLVLSTVLGGYNSKSVLSIQELKELATKIEAVENSISNMKIESQSWVETKTDFYDPCQSWQKTPICYLQTAWVQKSAVVKTRVDMRKEVFEWVDSPNLYGEKSYSMSFDGQQVRYVHHATGPLGQAHPVKSASVLPEIPRRLANGNFDTGAYWSLPFFDCEVYKFSEIFQLAGDPNSEVASELEFTLEEFGGTECIKIRSRLYDVTYWLEPSRGFALRGKKSIARYEDGHEEIVKLVKVTKLKKVAAGLWWPMEVSTISRPYAPGQPWRRFVYRASNVIANNPNFDESVFTVPFPEGYLVNDQVNGRKYTVGQQ
jgi:hypothetical protein